MSTDYMPFSGTIFRNTCLCIIIFLRHFDVVVKFALFVKIAHILRIVPLLSRKGGMSLFTPVISVFIDAKYSWVLFKCYGMDK